MRSLTLKLSLAFLVVGLVGVLLLSILVSQQTQREFNDFIDNRYQTEVVDTLAGYYKSNGSWSGVGAVVASDGSVDDDGQGMRIIPMVLMDARGQVVVDARPPNMRGISGHDGNDPVPVEVDGATVGFVIFPQLEGRINPRVEAETKFLEGVRRLITLSAIGAAAIALLLGIVLAQTITRPVRELTEATQAVAGGELGRQVAVQSKDELGELAAAFNQMSSDLLQGQQLRQQMTADIAHDLRTPLTVILGYTEALSDGKLPAEPEMLNAMHQQAQHLSRLVEDLRTLSLADAGQLSLHPQPVAPQGLLEQTAAAYGGQADARGVELAVLADQELPSIDVDPDRLLQVLGNLLSNALRFTPTGGRVTLSAERNDGSVLLRVRDTGPGIAQEDLPHVFDRFYRADKARSADGASGLGLAIVRSLVEANGGRVTADSRPGEGATFTLSFPARN